MKVYHNFGDFLEYKFSELVSHIKSFVFGYLGKVVENFGILVYVNKNREIVFVYDNFLSDLLFSDNVIFVVFYFPGCVDKQKEYFGFSLQDSEDEEFFNYVVNVVSQGLVKQLQFLYYSFPQNLEDLKLILNTVNFRNMVVSNPEVIYNPVLSGNNPYTNTPQTPYLPKRGCSKYDSNVKKLKDTILSSKQQERVNIVNEKQNKIFENNQIDDSFEFQIHPSVLKSIK